MRPDRCSTSDLVSSGAISMAFSYASSTAAFGCLVSPPHAPGAINPCAFGRKSDIILAK